MRISLIRLLVGSTFFQLALLVEPSTKFSWKFFIFYI